MEHERVREILYCRSLCIYGLFAKGAIHRTFVKFRTKSLGIVNELYQFARRVTFACYILQHAQPRDFISNFICISTGQQRSL